MKTAKRIKRFIQTQKPNPDPENITTQYWLKGACIKKAQNFVWDQKRLKAPKRESAGKTKLEICTTFDLANLLYKWCMDNKPCHFCGRRFLFLEEITINHNTPLSQGGNSLTYNLSPAHRECNRMHGVANDPSRV